MARRLGVYDIVANALVVGGCKVSTNNFVFGMGGIPVSFDSSRTQWSWPMRILYWWLPSLAWVKCLLKTTSPEGVFSTSISSGAHPLRDVVT